MIKCLNFLDNNTSVKLKCIEHNLKRYLPAIRIITWFMSNKLIIELYINLSIDLHLLLLFAIMYKKDESYLEYL